jgi:phospholipid/cholesterol/gamma-HCH transport system permease protein
MTITQSTFESDRQPRRATSESLEPGPSFGDAGRLVWDRVVGVVSRFGDICSMVLDAIAATATSLVKFRFAWSEFVEQAWFLISVCFLPTIMIAVPLGLVFVIEIGGLATQVGATSIVGAVDAIAIVREVAPVVTALLLSGAGGSAICADLGARTMREEIAALEVMAIDPVERLVAPRLLATVVVALLLNGVVAFAGIMTGYITSIVVLHGSAGGFLNSFSSFAQPSDFIESMVKAAVFGAMAAVVASHQGLRVSGGPAGVGEAVNRSVVITGLLLFLLNLLITQVFIAIEPPRVL